MASTMQRPLNDYYGPLLTRHLKAILESGLLLDEDYEVLLNACNFKIYPTHSGYRSLGIIAGTVAVIGSALAAWKCNNAALALPSLGALVLVYLERKATLKRKQRQGIVGDLIKSFSKVRKLNTAIIRYLKLRKAGKSTKENLLVEYNENVREFVKFFLKRNQEFLSLFATATEQLAGTLPELTEDFGGVKDILELEFLGDDYDEQSVSRVQDVYTFLASKYMHYLGYTFSRYLQDSPTPGINQLLDEKLPSFRNVLDGIRAEVQSEFNNLRYCVAQKVQIDVTKRCFPPKLTGKLHQTLTGAVNNLSLIMEKSRVVLGKVEELEENTDVTKVDLALRDLRDHALATYESLDVLCKLYGILSDAPKTSTVDLRKSPVTNSETETLVTICYDDHQEVAEEDYELFIPDGGEEMHTEGKLDAYPDQSGAYLGLMLKELRQALKEHERFVAARNKRGVQDEEEVAKPPEEVAKFDLAPPTPVPAPRSSKMAPPPAALLPELLPPSLPPPPPPPPPPPRKLVVKVADRPDMNLLDSIKLLSSQLEGEEEVFGSGAESD